MASAINIPSPSVFLRKSPPPPDQPGTEQKKPPDRKNAPQAKRQNSATEGKKKAARKSANLGSGGNGGDGVVKPKQSKSRNGQSVFCVYYNLAGLQSLYCRCAAVYARTKVLTVCCNDRMCDVQSETIEVW